MPLKTQSATVLRFGAFELDLRSCELRKKGVRIKLQEQPFQVLTVLLQHPGVLVTREEIRSAIWPVDTFVDFDNSLNTAVNKLREALGDSAENQHFIETVPRHGYRFLAPVTTERQEPPITTRLPSATAKPRSLRWVVASGGAALLLIAAMIAVGMSHFVRTRGRITSIAVVPFANTSGDPNTEYLSDGITEGIIDKLSGLANIKVISRASAFRYKKSEIEPQKVAKDLSVDALVMGTVTQRGDDLSISAELVDAREDSHLWGHQYHRRLTDMGLVPEEIAESISEHLRMRITSEEKARLTKSYTTNPEAYQLYLKGRYFANQGTDEGFKKSIAYFQQAIDKEPGNALAYAGLADSYAGFAVWSDSLPPTEVLPKAKDAALRAVEIDDTLAEAHAALAYATFFDWDWPRAEREFLRAIELSPNSAVSRQRYSEVLVARTRFDEAMAEMKRAEELDPLSPQIIGSLGFIYLASYRYDEAIVECQKALDLYPNLGWIRMQLGVAYALKRTYPQALSEFRKIADQDKVVAVKNQFVASSLAGVYALSGRRSDALEIAKELKDLSRRAYVDSYLIASIYADLGEKDEAFRLLEKAYGQHSALMPYLAVDPLLYNLRSDARYQDLLRRMGLPLQGTGGIPQC